MPERVLIVVHQEHSNPGRVGELLVERGCALDRRCPSLGDPLPDDLAPYRVAIVFGGPQSANDDHLPGIKAELDWLERTALPADLPLLGICLGAQMIARVLGAVITTRLGSRPAIAYLADVRRDDLLTLKGLIEAGKVRPIIDRTYRFEQIPEGIRYVESGAAAGKVVITV